MCMPKAPKPTVVPERQAAQMPQTDARARSGYDATRRRGFSSLIVAGKNAALQPAATTPTILGS